LYSLAAERFSKRITKEPNWHRDQSLKKAIIRYLNAQIERNEGLSAIYHSGRRQGITLKWLGWQKHQRAIEKAVKESADAESKRA
jgi:hypothetical protein